ncbi:MAG: M17 family peptidase N-terminal domain-containing protein, partial [Gemmatimonadales bacterium]
MKTAVVARALAETETPLLAIAVAQGDLPASLAALDRAAGGALTRAFASGDFKGNKDETCLLYPAAGPAQRILLLGLGKAGDVTRTSV